MKRSTPGNVTSFNNLPVVIRECGDSHAQRVKIFRRVARKQ